MSFCAIFPMAPTPDEVRAGVVMQHVRMCFDDAGNVTERTVLGDAATRKSDGTVETHAPPIEAQVRDLTIDAPRRAVATAAARAAGAAAELEARAASVAAGVAGAVEGAAESARNVAIGVAVAIGVGVLLVIAAIGWLIYKLPVLAPHIAKTAASGAVIAKSVS